MPPSRGSVSGRSILGRVAVHVADIAQDGEYTLPIGTTIGYRTALAVPMLQDGAAHRSNRSGPRPGRAVLR